MYLNLKRELLFRKFSCTLWKICFSMTSQIEQSVYLTANRCEYNKLIQMSIVNLCYFNNRTLKYPIVCKIPLFFFHNTPISDLGTEFQIAMKFRFLHHNLKKKMLICCLIISTECILLFFSRLLIHVCYVCVYVCT